MSFYSEVMGWHIIMEPSTVKKERDTAMGQMCIDVFGDDWETFEIAQLATSGGIGIELFSFPHGRKEAPAFRHFHTGLSTFACSQAINSAQVKLYADDSLCIE
ncbi:hypothetical protein AB9P05_16160 [Roseivirga sp. BDSF3-8]|uniref:hypothetical protein n=1 Tax=Roseivirga sp. BDSF3-8 TaxID=3241598 RepID=UPI003532391C